MESQTVDTLKKEDTQENRQFINRQIPVGAVVSQRRVVENGRIFNLHEKARLDS